VRLLWSTFIAEDFFDDNYFSSDLGSIIYRFLDAFEANAYALASDEQNYEYRMGFSGVTYANVQIFMLNLRKYMKDKMNKDYLTNDHVLYERINELFEKCLRFDQSSIQVREEQKQRLMQQYYGTAPVFRVKFPEPLLTTDDLYWTPIDNSQRFKAVIWRRWFAKVVNIIILYASGVSRINPIRNKKRETKKDKEFN